MSAYSATSDVFAAISAPARREILALLADGDMPVQELAASFSMSLPGVSQHLAVLREAGLVSVRKEGRQRIYRLNAKPLKEVSQWVEDYEKFWSGKLGALGKYLKETSR
jgi:DNA-binding transcriptional ArsR family regulator